MWADVIIWRDLLCFQGFYRKKNYSCWGFYEITVITTLLMTWSTEIAIDLPIDASLKPHILQGHNIHKFVQCNNSPSTHPSIICNQLDPPLKKKSLRNIWTALYTNKTVLGHSLNTPCLPFFDITINGILVNPTHLNIETIFKSWELFYTM